MTAGTSGYVQLSQFLFVYGRILPLTIKYVLEESYINAIVNVPAGSLSLYQNTAPWNNFWNLKEDNGFDTGINNASTTINAEELTRYTVNGRKISAPSKGLNIIRYNDGSVKKVVVQ